jgi:hypothetical protein
MKKQALRAAAVMALLGLHPAVAAATAVWDAVSDFSGSSNPSGAWAYGHGVPGWTFLLFPDSSTYSVGPTDFWERCPGCAPPNLGKGAIPFVSKNMGAAYNFGGSVVVPAGVLFVHPGSLSDVLVQWTAPTTGSYSYSGKFELLSTVPTGVVGRVFGGTIHGNDTLLFWGLLKGPGANLSTMTPGESETFNGTVSLLAGETLTFAVNNDNGNYTNDSTGLTATITWLGPELLPPRR